MSAAQETYYKIARTTEQLCGLLQVDPTAVMRRMRFPPDFLQNEGRGVSAADYFAGWNAILAEADREDTPLMLGRAYARGAIQPSLLCLHMQPQRRCWIGTVVTVQTADRSIGIAAGSNSVQRARNSQVIQPIRPAVASYVCSHRTCFLDRGNPRLHRPPFGTARCTPTCQVGLPRGS